MKKKFLFMILIIVLMLSSITYGAISESFYKTLSIMEIPIQNVDGYEINEEIYQKYHLLVYGSPKDVIKDQRWKDVDTGKWFNEATGKKGEYRVLGYGLTGTVVNNEIFPDDYNSGKSPEEWNYIVIDDAYHSWNDTEKYQTQEQYEYMLNQPLTRNGVTYSLTAKTIGINKARLEAFATWKTAGSIYTLKKDSDGNLWGATFHVPPMAADATLQANLLIENGEVFRFAEGQEQLIIPFSFGATVSHLGEYARVEDIKMLSSELEIQNSFYDKVIAEQQTQIQKENQYVIRKADYPGANKIEITFKNTAILETRFQTEAPMVDIKEVTIQVVFQEEQENQFVAVKTVNKQYVEDIPRPVISSINLYRKSITGEKQKIPLWIAKKTNTLFICAGQVLVVEARISNSPTYVSFAIEGDASIQTLDALTQRFVYEEPKERREKMMYSTLNGLKKSYQLPRTMTKQDGVYSLEYVIPYQTKQTIHSWNTLRNMNQNAFQIDENQLLARITQPYQIKIKASNEGGITTRSVKLDVFERWDTIYNRDISEYVK